MAIFHSNIQIITRGKGKSAVAAAAYRAGETIKNEYDGVVHDYTRKKSIMHTEILLPGYAPAEYSDRAVLWNAVERIEKASNSQLAREIDIALPTELTLDQNIVLARDYVQSAFVEKGMCADLCVHDEGKGNPHAHIMLTMRPINEDGTWGGKQKKEYILDADGNKQYDQKKRQYKCRSIPSTDWNERTKADEWRQDWEDMVNAELERLGFDSRIDRRSYAEQGIEQIPAVHMGISAMQLERRGIRTERGDINRAIGIRNAEIKQLRARINKLNRWIAEETINEKPPTLAEVLDEIMSRQGQSSLTRLQNGAEIFSFLMRNEIYSKADLDKKVGGMSGKLSSIREDMKKVNRRIDTLNEHLMQTTNFTNYRKHNVRYEKLYAQYREIKKAGGLFSERKAQKAREAANDYYELYRPQIAMYKNAEEYLQNVMQGHFDPKKLPPIKKLQEEHATMTIGANQLYLDYTAVKDETTKIERIQRSITAILKSARQEQMQKKHQERLTKKTRGLDL